MATTLAQLAKLIGGQLTGSDAVADGLSVCGVGTLDEATSGQITFIDRADKLPRLAESSAAAAIVPQGVAVSPIPAIAVADVHRAFAAVVAHFKPPRATGRIGVSPQAVIAASAKLAADVDIHPLATIGEDVEIGRGSTIHAGVRIMAGSKIGAKVTICPNAVLYENTIVGDRVLIHAGAILGGHGFGFELVDGRHQPGAQLGHVEIGDDVEIGAATAIDRGSYGATIIGEGTKIDNLVQIAHNVRLGKHNIICAQVGIAGSTSTGDYVVLAGQVGIRDHVQIGAQTMVGAQAGVVNDVAPGSHMLGSPAVDLHEQKLMFAAMSRLPEMRKEFKALKRAVEQLQSQLASAESRNGANGHTNGHANGLANGHDDVDVRKRAN